VCKSRTHRPNQHLLPKKRGFIETGSDRRKNPQLDKQKVSPFLQISFFRSSGCRFSMKKIFYFFLKKARTMPWETRRKTGFRFSVRKDSSLFLFGVQCNSFCSQVLCSYTLSHLKGAFLQNCGSGVLKKREVSLPIFPYVSFPWCFIFLPEGAVVVAQERVLRP